MNIKAKQEFFANLGWGRGQIIPMIWGVKICEKLLAKLYSPSSIRYFILFFAVAAVFLGALANPQDFDLGWHLKYGEYVAEHKSLLLENTFSSAMPEYRYVNHAWGTDVMTYVIFKQFGFLGLSVVGSLVIAAAWFVFARASRFDFWQMALTTPLALYFFSYLLGESFRGQFLSLLFFGVLWLLLRRFEEGRQWNLWFIPPLFFIWANVHGQFLMGLMLFALWIAGCIYTKGIKKAKLLFAILIASALFALINPFGFGVYQEAFRHFNNPLGKYIIEWQSPWLSAPIAIRVVALALLLLVAFLLAQRKRILFQRLSWFLPASIVVLFALLSRRYLSPGFLISMPLIGLLLEYVKPRREQHALVIAAIILFVTYGFVGFWKLPSENIFDTDWGLYCRHIGCSPASAEFLRNNTSDPATFLNYYNWGGWLIWNYPDIKPRVDGRMTFWEDQSGYSAFGEYLLYENGINNIDGSWYNVVYIPPAIPLADNLQRFVPKAKWSIG